ncbi:nuclear receptor coactivator 2-like isoform X2 [Mercenaria mercenaria]|nr:nuclear receptor coactivator 2-like isoform X2 [Mercenaria mercenaria]XP_053383144.1 nuclear receptor coactivator 2-like isoform X2 [Mercenaria mercenaria]
MSSTFSVKPEKCAILQETVKQIKQIKQGNSGGGDSAVQQSQVSSSKPAILADDILGPLLLEALDGFLFVVNSQGKVEFVSENVSQFIKYTQDDLIGKSVYNIIHVGDHAQFSNNLLPMSVSSGIGGISWPSDNLVGKGRVFSCRLLIKPSCNDNDDLETKQTYVHQYKSLQISSILHPSDTFTENSDSNDTTSSLVCIARRLPLAEKTNTMLGVEQFTTKQDLNGKIIGCDISGIAPGRFSCPDFVGQNIQEFCHTNDLQQLSKHLQEAVKNGSNTSGVYRFKMQESRYAFVQTKSKLFQNPINGSSEFIMSTHSIIRECDSDNELKGSASTSLMKSIIGPSLQQTLQKAQTPVSNVNTSMASMALVGNKVMPSMNSGSLYGVNDNSSDDFFSQLGWDGNLSDSSVSSTGNSFMNTTYQSVANSSTSAFSNSWNSQLKLSQVQQQLQRSFSTSSQRNQVANSNNMTGAGNKRPSVLLGQLGQRSTSLDLGQMQSQGQVLQPQKSPSYAQNRNGGFQIPSQRNVMGYSRRSPAASPVPSMGQGNFNTPFSPRTPSPMLSPSPGMPQPGWGNQPMTSNASQSGHQLYDDQSSYTHERLFQRLTGLEGLTGDKKVKRSGKLCQLLTQNSPPSSSRKSEPGTPKGGRSRHNSRQGYMEMSPADSIQSPQPGPGQSPPEKPQSTSNDDGEHVVHTEHKDSNRLLKSLLSQDDDTEDEQVKEENSAAKREQTAEAQAVPQKSVSSMEMEKNEAEAKKPNNILLKQLLSTDERSVAKESTSDSKKSIIHKLLDDDSKNNCRSAPAESTSIDSELARQRHQSGPQEPQSTTTHSLPMPPLSSPLTSPVTPNFDQSQRSSVDTSLLKGLFSSSSSLSLNQVTNTNSSAFASTSGSVDTQSTDMREDGFAAAREKKIDKLLHLLWEDNSDDGVRETMREKIQNLKRKADMLEGGDTEQSSAFSGELTSSQASRLTKENALLTQLLSKKANNDIVVNTLSTIQPSGIPQQRIPQNLASKLLKVNPSSFNTTNSGNEAKRARTDSGNNNQLSTLERALSAPKQDINPISSTQPFDALMEIGQNSNSGISNISDSSVTSQFNNQLSELHQILQSTISDTGNNSTNVTEVNLDDNTDPLLAQILQQAQDLQQDITLGSFPGSNQNVPQSLSLDSGPVNNSAQSMLNHPSLNNNSYQKNNTNTDILQQLEQALNDSNFNLDSLLGNSNVSSMDEQVAIDAIQKQLMMDMPGLSTGVSASNAQTPTVDSGRVQNRFAQNIPVPNPAAGSQIQQNMLGNQLPERNQGAPGMFQSIGSLRQGVGGPGRPLQQLPGYNQATAAGQNYPGQGPRLPHPQGALQSPTQQQRPMFANSNPNSTAMQVRQSLLQQQKLKQMRERNKHVQQQQDRQKLLMQQQQRSQFSPQYSGQRGPQDNLSLGGNNVIPQFPENLAELMNSATAPNVTLQRNQIPGPMSPRYQTLQGQPPQSPNMGSMMPPNPQLSPNFSQTQQQQQQQQWNIRQGQTSLAISPQGTAQYSNRHRSLSGGTLQASPPQRFPFNDGQYSGNQQLGNLYSQQQQQLYQQNRGGQLQRQLSRGGSPRASQSPFGPNSDPLLISPHNVSPNSMRGPQQVSPSYSQGGMGTAFGQGSMTSQPSSLPSPQYSQNQGQGQMGLNAHNMDIDLNSLFDSSKKPLDVPLSVNTPGPSKTIKEELRNFCNARSQNSLQGQSSLQNSLQGQSSLQNSLQGQSSLQNSLQGQSSLQNQNFLQNQTAMQGHNSLQSQVMAAQQSQQFMSPTHHQQPQQQQQQQQPPQHQQSVEHDAMSELPFDILEQINEMSQDHGINLPEYKEEVIVPKKREEAKSRYVKFQQLANSEDPDSKATNLFRKQLTSQGKGRPTSASADTSAPAYTEPQSSVNIVQNKPRTPIEEIKPANQKDSLLQQLLSD